MTRQNWGKRFAIGWLFAGLILFASFVSTPVQAQTKPVVPYVSEVIVNPEAQRATAYFGFRNPNPSAINFAVGEPNNYFFPAPQDRGQPTRFIPGDHPYAFAVVFDYNVWPTITWGLNGLYATADPASAGANTPQTSVFTYQGRLSESNAPANGLYRMRFSLFDTEANGTPIGSPLEMTNVIVTTGLFTVPLDFGSAPFSNGSSRFLQIEVSPGTNVTYTALEPRQRITSTPYATRAFSAATADNATSAQQLSGTSANLFVQTTDPRLSDTRTPTSGTLGQSVHTVYGTGQLAVNTNTTTYTLVPGLSQTINVPANSVIIASTDGGIQSTGTTSNSFSAVDVGIFVDGAVSSQAGQKRVTILNGSGLAMVGNWNMSVTRELLPGNHTFEVKAINAVPGTVPANVSSSATPLLQGRLTVTLIRK